ncbi:MAG: hypothetical protein E6H75_16035 [Betaproteobacteria bacterium]|nr:MAG: hypothetical protein E6H75_16035 [Betaproteobacteria bacterium]
MNIGMWDRGCTWPPIPAHCSARAAPAPRQAARARAAKPASSRDSRIRRPRSASCRRNRPR